MTDYMGILRMKSKGFSATAIASSLGVNKRTVLSCINRAAEAGFGYPFPDGTTNGSKGIGPIGHGQGGQQQLCPPRFRRGHA